MWLQTDSETDVAGSTTHPRKEWNRDYAIPSSSSGQLRPEDLATPSSATDQPQPEEFSTPSSAYDLHTEILTASTSPGGQLNAEDFFSPSSASGQPTDEDFATSSPVNGSSFHHEGPTSPPSANGPSRLDEGSPSPNLANDAYRPSESSPPPILANVHGHTTARANRPPTIRILPDQLVEVEMQARVIGSREDILECPDDDTATITTELPDSASTDSFEIIEEPDDPPHILPSRAHENARNTTFPSSSSRNAVSPRSAFVRPPSHPHDWHPGGARMFRRTLYRPSSSGSTSAQGTELDGFPDGLQMFVGNSNLRSPRFIATQQTLFDSPLETNRSEAQVLWRVWAGLSVVFLFTIGWSVLFMGMVHLYRMNQMNPHCDFTYSPWFTSDIAEARVADNTSSMPFLLFWGISSHLLPMIQSMRVFVSTLNSRMSKLLIHLFLYKSNIPWYVMMCISVIQWHYCRIDVAPLCPRGFVNAIYFFSVYSTLYVIFALIALHTLVSFWVTQEELRERRLEFHARVTELENQIQYARTLNGGPPIVQMGDILRILLDSDRRASRGAPGLVDKLDTITWPALRLADASETECSICFIGFEEDLQIIKCPCEHYFHKKCLACWFEMADTCPLCRKSCRISEEREPDFPLPSLSRLPFHASTAIISQYPQH
eukprot:GEMP01015298.1.p1 GENE.GEMP01015298.1~~GEMP01015298.1.p1  ORF type:complete len:661 (+),score=120.03 GEMP01015298.1:76-2058(+)